MPVEVYAERTDSTVYLCGWLRTARINEDGMLLKNQDDFIRTPPSITLTADIIFWDTKPEKIQIMMKKGQIYLL